ncbi:hypothetical protein KKA85_10820 [bacterium]|nr:hypothetical protein [bacterium]MBU1676261.1 hypothetical protein [bacterium]
MNDAKIPGESAEGRRAAAEPDEPGMLPVAARLAPQHGLGQQPFPPQGDQTARIEVFRMQGPDRIIGARSFNSPKKARQPMQT